MSTDQDPQSKFSFDSPIVDRLRSAIELTASEIDFTRDRCLDRKEDTKWHQYATMQLNKARECIKPQHLNWFQRKFAGIIRLFFVLNTVFGRREYRVDAGWKHLHAALRLQLYGLTENELKARAKIILAEAPKKLSGWRKEAVKSILEPIMKGDYSIKDLASVVEQAEEIVHEHFANLYHNVSLLTDMVRVVFVQLLWTLVPLFVLIRLSPIDLSSKTLEIVNITITNCCDEISWLAMIWCFLKWLVSAPIHIYCYIFLFGALGSIISAAFFAISSKRLLQIPDQVTKNSMLFARPTIGGTSAIAIYVLLMSGLVHFGEMTNGLILSIAFASGFSERLLTKTIDKLIATSEKSAGSETEKKASTSTNTD